MKDKYSWDKISLDTLYSSFLSNPNFVYFFKKKLINVIRTTLCLKTVVFQNVCVLRNILIDSSQKIIKEVVFNDLTLVFCGLNFRKLFLLPFMKYSSILR